MENAMYDTEDTLEFDIVVDVEWTADGPIYDPLDKPTLSMTCLAEVVVPNPAEPLGPKLAEWLMPYYRRCVL